MSTAERDQSPARFPTEETSLLAGTVDEAQSPPQPQATPLPYAQLAALCLVRLVDPLNFTQIFPYVNEMMERLHLTDDPNKIGFYSGLVESSFAVSQLCCIYNWARISGKQFIAATVTLVVSEVLHPDKIGRRPVVLTGILGIGLSTMILGTAHSLAAIILARCVGG